MNRFCNRRGLLALLSFCVFRIFVFVFFIFITLIFVNAFFDVVLFGINDLTMTRRQSIQHFLTYGNCLKNKIEMKCNVQKNVNWNFNVA